MAQLSTKLSFQDLLTKWSSILNPIIGNPTTNPTLLQGIKLINGATTINHNLGQMMQGWKITDQDASANVYRSAPLNASTLTLTSNAAVTINLEVF